MEEGGNSLHFCLRMKQLLHILYPKVGPDATYPDIISLGLWFLQYYNLGDILGSNFTRASIRHEPMYDN